MPALAADYVRAGSATTLSSSRRYAAGPNQNHFSYNTQVQPQEKTQSSAELKPQNPSS